METWSDCTSYSRGVTERVPTTFQVKSGTLRISICNDHVHHRGEWIMHCGALGFDTVPLSKGLTFEEAKQEAVKRVGNRLAKLQDDLGNIAPPSAA